MNPFDMAVPALLYIQVRNWEDFKRLLESKGVKEIYYTILDDTRQIVLKFTDGIAIYEHITPRDYFEYDCGLYVDPEEEVRRMTKPEEVENEILGGVIRYLVGSQKIRGFNMWFIYSNFGIEAREFIAKQLKDYILIEGDILPL